MLPEDYYCRNFLALTRFVHARCDDILSLAERAWFECVESLPRDALRLYVRLLCRRGSTFRVGRLRYDEIASIDGAIDRLVAAGLAERTPPPMASLSALLSRAELVALVGTDRRDRRRRALLETMLLESGDAALATRAAALDRWVSLVGREHFATFMLCFFGNARQDLSEFVCRDLGHSTWPTYPVDREARAFRDRRALEAHLACMRCETRLDEIPRDDATALERLAESLPDPRDDDASLHRRRGRLLDTIGRRLERLGAFEPALAVYTRSGRPPSRERLVRLLHRTGENRRALDLVRDMLAGDADDAERQFAETWHRRLAVACRESPPPPTRFRPCGSRLVLRRSSLRVEEASRRYFARRGECHYTENALVTGVLGLFVWDITYSAVPGAFFNPFQAAPADFHGREFRCARREALQLRLAEIEDPAAMRTRVLEQFERRRGCLNGWVQWTRLTPALLERALDRIPGRHWRAMFDRLLDDPVGNASGWPDLVLFPREGGYELLEIKGPGDALQRHQRRWMRHFDRHGIPYRCVQVRWTDASGPPRVLPGAPSGPAEVMSTV